MDFNTVYCVLMLIFGVLAILFNILLLVIMWTSTPKNTKNLAIMIAHLTVLQIGASLLIMVMQPR